MARAPTRAQAGARATICHSMGSPPFPPLTVFLPATFLYYRLPVPKLCYYYSYTQLLSLTAEPAQQKSYCKTFGEYSSASLVSLVPARPDSPISNNHLCTLSFAVSLLLQSVPNPLLLLFSRSPSPRLHCSSWPPAISLLPSHHLLTSTPQKSNCPTSLTPCTRQLVCHSLQLMRALDPRLYLCCFVDVCSRQTHLSPAQCTSPPCLLPDAFIHQLCSITRLLRPLHLCHRRLLIPPAVK
jgi:hypothetical protein